MASPTKSSPTIALLGATGKTGRVILRLLLAKDRCNLKIYVRSKEKLVAMFPDITSNPRVQLYVGCVTDQNAIQECLSGAQIIICTIGNNDWAPTTALRDSAQSIVTALKALKQRGSMWERPRMIWLSSASRNERFAADRPKVVHWLIETAFQNGYADLKVAQRVIFAEPSLVSVVLVQPGLLVEEEGTGYEISTEAVKLASSYEDLGGAFVELAFERRYDELHEVGVSSKQGDRVARYAPIILQKLSGGFFVCYFPGGARIIRAVKRVLSWIS